MAAEPSGKQGKQSVSGGDKAGGKPSREERLAAALRDNLKKRKAQARAKAGKDTG